MKLLPLLPLLCLLTACHPKAAPKASLKAADRVAALAAGNTMRCQVGELTLAGTGPDAVGIAGFGIKADTLSAFALSLHAEQGGKLHVVTSSLMALPMHTGTYHFPALDTAGMTYASYDIRTLDRDLLRQYNGANYSQHFSPVENDPEAKLKIVVDRMIVSAADLPGFQRVHAVGHFQFNGAALPGAEPSEACVKDGVQRSIASLGASQRLLPMFNAQVCGTEKKHVECQFDVVGDFIVQK